MYVLSFILGCLQKQPQSSTGIWQLIFESFSYKNLPSYANLEEEQVTSSWLLHVPKSWDVNTTCPCLFPFSFCSQAFCLMEEQRRENLVLQEDINVWRVCLQCNAGILFWRGFFSAFQSVRFMLVYFSPLSSDSYFCNLL